MSMIGQTISTYEILEQLGEGGMGVVYLARDTKLERRVALKFLPPEMSRDDEANERFVQEAKAASALNHQNVCSVYDIKETHDGRLFIVMPAYEGQTLKYRLKAGPLDRANAIDIARQVAEGLAAAHRKDIVHRDIKPANIMVVDDGRVVILDFGLAKLTGGLELTKTGSTLGTSYYMSPEQIRGEPVDHRSDIWSIGVVLYQMLSGKRPFQGDYEQAISYAILNQHPIDDFDSDTAHVVRRCIEKDKDNRFQSAGDLAAALREIQSPSGLHTAPPEPSTPLRSKSSLGRIGMGAGVLTALLLAIFFAFQSGSGPSGTDSDSQPTRLVVLPFDNLGSPDDEYFADGMTEEITMRLASLSGMAVISQNTAAQYKNTNKTIEQIGSELGVNYVLGGSVRWDKRSSNEEMVRITPRLIRVSDDTNVWTETYERAIEGVFAIQTEVAEDVAAELNVTLLAADIEDLSRRPTDNLEAYHAYLRGKAIGRGSLIDVVNAVPAFETAIRLDPEFVDAYYHLAHTYILGAWLGTSSVWEEYVSKAEEYAGRVRELAPGSVQDHLLAGYRSYYLDLEFEEALDHFTRAAEIDPRSFEARLGQAFINRRLGNFARAAELLVQIVEGQPDLTTLTEAAQTHMILRRHERADEFFQRGIVQRPHDPSLYCARAWNVILWTGDTDLARQIELEAPNVNTKLPCWWSDLAEGRFEKILQDLDRVDVDEIAGSSDWYGYAFTKQTMHYHYRRALSARYADKKDLERASWESLIALLEDEGRTAPPERERYRNNESVAELGFAIANAGAGNTSLAREILKRHGEATAHDQMLTASIRWLRAHAYMLLGDHDQAIELLEEDLASNGIITRPFLEIPFWDELRGNPRFEALRDR